MLPNVKSINLGCDESVLFLVTTQTSSPFFKNILYLLVGFLVVIGKKTRSFGKLVIPSKYQAELLTKDHVGYVSHHARLAKFVVVASPPSSPVVEEVHMFATELSRVSIYP
jgi:hypothetical protein